MIVLLLGACVFIPLSDLETGSADGADGSTDGADGSADGADGSTDGADGSGDGADGSGDGADGTTDSPWAGAYTGTLEMTLTGGLVGTDTCTGDLSLTVSDAGEIAGTWDCEGIDGTLGGSVSGAEADGPIVLQGDLSDNGYWEGFVVDAAGGTISGDFDGTGSSTTLGNPDYDGSFEATR